MSCQWDRCEIPLQCVAKDLGKNVGRSNNPALLFINERPIAPAFCQSTTNFVTTFPSAKGKGEQARPSHITRILTVDQSILRTSRKRFHRGKSPTGAVREADRSVWFILAQMRAKHPPLRTAELQRISNLKIKMITGYDQKTIEPYGVHSQLAFLGLSSIRI